jgi:tetratricopeptide (TPR) repeat protein
MSRRGVCLAVVSWLWVSAAYADTPVTPAPEQQQKADQLFEQGRKLLQAEDAAGACEKFNLAIQLDPTAAGTMLNLGLCNQKLKKYKTALYWFRKAQFRATETHLPAHETAAREHTTELAKLVATVKITFSEPPPAGARVKIDGEEIKSDDYSHAEVDSGHHVLDAGAPGKRIVHLEFDVDGTGGGTLPITFVAGESSIVVDRGHGKRRAALYLAIGGAVLWGTSVGVSKWASDRYSEEKAKFVAGNGNEFAVHANHYRNIARYGGTGLFIGGAALIAAGAILYLTAPQSERIDQTVFAPTIGPDQIGFAAAGSF